MSKAYHNQDYLVPVKGVNTEANPLAFPEGFCASAMNVELDYNPLRVRVRKGLEIQDGYVELTDYQNDTSQDAFTSTVWHNVNHRFF